MYHNKKERSYNMRDYLHSNKVESVSLNRFSKKWGNSVLELGDNSSYKVRRCESQNLIDYLCDKFKIQRVGVAIYDIKRPCKRNGQIHGTYTRIGSGSCKIVVYNRTAKRGDIISIKEYFDTLIHEFIHHYDYEVLKLNKSSHTSGFYKRISDLKNKLI